MRNIKTEEQEISSFWTNIIYTFNLKRIGLLRVILCIRRYLFESIDNLKVYNGNLANIYLGQGKNKAYD